MSEGTDAPQQDPIVRLRGMPWSATADDIIKFLGSEINVAGGKDGIHFTFTRDGRASGEAYVTLEGETDVEAALKKSNENMGSRYIEVFRAKKSELDWCLKKSSSNALDEGIVRLRGIPFGCSKEEIANFFSGLEIVANGIVIPVDFDGRTAGDAYVQFSSKEAAEKALEKHKERIGHRYIEIFKSSLSEMESSLNLTMRPPYGHGGFGGRGGGFGGPPMGGPRGVGRPGPYDRMMGRPPPPRPRDDGYGGGYGGGDDYGRRGGGLGKAPGGFGGGAHIVHMRGMPFKATEADVHDFFAPLRPVRVHFLFEAAGRPSGECDVQFASHRDAQEAMSRNNAHMGTRYVELFLKSSPKPGPGVPPPHHGNGHHGGYYAGDYDDVGYGGGYGSNGSAGGYGGGYGAGHAGNLAGYGSGGVGGFRSGGHGGASMGGHHPGAHPAASHHHHHHTAHHPAMQRANGGPPGHPAHMHHGASHHPHHHSMAPPHLSVGGGGGPLPLSGGGGHFGGGGVGGHFVHMRGLPYKAIDDDVYQFFEPIRPIDVRFIFDAAGRPSGECDVEFASHRDAQDAMSRNNAHMGNRYVELFLKSAPAGGRGGPVVGGGFGGPVGSGPFGNGGLPTHVPSYSTNDY